MKVAGGDVVEAEQEKEMNREIAIMQLLQIDPHPNIVNLVAVEKDEVTKKGVIVMEKCEGKSLKHFLGLHKNGLSDEEFLIVMEHIGNIHCNIFKVNYSAANMTLIYLVAGVKHLRQNQIVHRDIKPANIMRQIKADGSSVFKLGDFGAAIVLEDDDEFGAAIVLENGDECVSVHGTLDYMVKIFISSNITNVKNN